jgi:hypothetical protein
MHRRPDGPGPKKKRSGRGGPDQALKKAPAGGEVLPPAQAPRLEHSTRLIKGAHVPLQWHLDDEWEPFRP